MCSISRATALYLSILCLISRATAYAFSRTGKTLCLAWTLFGARDKRPAQLPSLHELLTILT
jgi:hypothetical protein